MDKLKIYHRYGEELERRLRLKTFPLAIKFLKNEKEIPKGTQRPLKDLPFVGKSKGKNRMNYCNITAVLQIGDFVLL